MILNDKSDCVDSIVTTLERTAAWRRTTAAKFPDDRRNAPAASKLEQLAIDAVNLNDEQWGDLQGHFGGWASQSWQDALVQAARMVGFSHRSGNFDSFVRLMVRQFPQASVAE
jgi:hypothetical protein